MASTGNAKPLGCAWYLTGVCNYDCPYCYDQAKPQVHPSIRMADVAGVFGALQEARGPLEIALTGGEPTLHPAFGDILAYLSGAGHDLVISTNLSCGPEPFLEAARQPSRCSLNASFHPSHADMREFGPAVRRLLDAGFRVVPSYVMYPPNVEALPRHEAELHAFAPGLAFGRMAFLGEWQGRHYPLAPQGEPGSESPAAGSPGERGAQARYCRAGQDYFAVLWTGEIARCVAGAPLTGDRWPTVRLVDRALPCALDCHCADMHRLWADGPSDAKDGETT